MSSGGTWTGEGVQSVKLKIDSGKSGIEVTLNKNADKTPRAIGISFIDSKGGKTTVELKAIEPPSGPASLYQGKFEPWSSSFVGFELRIPFGKKPKIIRSEQLKKVE